MLLAIYGKSATGKSTLSKYLSDTYDYKEVITCTTRGKRDGETDGVDYIFVTDNEFYMLIKEGKMLEYNYYVKGMYGILKDSIELKTRQNLVVEPNGLHAINRKIDDERVISVYLECDNKDRFIRQILRGDDILEIALRNERDSAIFQECTIRDLTDIRIFVDNKTTEEIALELLEKLELIINRTY